MELSARFGKSGISKGDMRFSLGTPWMRVPARRFPRLGESRLILPHGQLAFLEVAELDQVDANPSHDVEPDVLQRVIARLAFDRLEGFEGAFTVPGPAVYETNQVLDA